MTDRHGPMSVDWLERIKLLAEQLQDASHRLLSEIEAEREQRERERDA